MFNTDDLLGIPFLDGGRDPRIGLDCWGLVLEIFRRYGIDLPDYRIACEDASRIDQEIDANRWAWIRVTSSAPPVPSLVVMRFNHPVLCNHTGVYIGDGLFIHTRQPIGVNIDRINSPAWARKIEGFYVPGPSIVNGKEGEK